MQKRKSVVFVVVTEAEKERLKRSADFYGLTISNFLRLKTGISMVGNYVPQDFREINPPKPEDNIIKIY